jgi:N-acetyltransferase
MDGFIVKIPMKAPEKRPLNNKKIDFSKRNAIAKPRHKKTQLYLDFGQISFGRSVICSKCGMVYLPSEEMDNQKHEKHCNDSIRVQCSKNLSFISVGEGKDRPSNPSDMILLGKSDLGRYPAVVESCLALVRKELGLSADFLASKQPVETTPIQIYLYIRNKTFIGSLICEEVPTSRLITLHYTAATGFSTSKDLTNPRPTSAIKTDEHNNTTSMLASTLSVALGIRALWVNEAHRREGIASRLVDAARGHFFFGRVVERRMVAISDPTVDGFHFTARYCGPVTVGVDKERWTASYGGDRKEQRKEEEEEEEEEVEEKTKWISPPAAVLSYLPGSLT